MKHLGVIVGGTLVVIATLLFALWYASPDREREVFAKDIEYTEGTLTFEGGVIRIAFAETDQERHVGLSRQRTIREDEGLLFIFNKSAEHGIWMRDMYFSIDIIWLDDELRVVGIKENATPESFRSVRDAEVFTPGAPAQYVLEVRAGFADAHKVVAGTLFQLAGKR